MDTTNDLLDVAVTQSIAAKKGDIFTNSEATFPVTGGPDLTYNGSFGDAFVAKVQVLGGGLVYAGYIGGSRNDVGYGIAVDTTGSAYVTGMAQSNEATFPVTIGPDLTHNGDRDAFVAKVQPDGRGLVYAGYIGGKYHDEGLGIAVDAAGNAYITGHTQSDEATFPVTGGPDLTYNGSTDAFVAKIQPDGTGLVYCGYIGGYNEERGHGIAVDTEGNAYVAGFTGSTEATFPVTIGPDLTFNGGTYDAFVAKVAEICAVSKPRLLSPENGAPVTAQRVSLKWKAAKCAEWYNVVVTRDSPKGRTVYQESNLTTRQVKTKKLARGKTYFWQVEACNAVGCTLSKRWKFTISATAATEALNRDD